MQEKSRVAVSLYRISDQIFVADHIQDTDKVCKALDKKYSGRFKIYEFNEVSLFPLKSYHFKLSEYQPPLFEQLIKLSADILETNSEQNVAIAIPNDNRSMSVLCATVMYIHYKLESDVIPAEQSIQTYKSKMPISPELTPSERRYLDYWETFLQKTINLDTALKLKSIVLQNMPFQYDYVIVVSTKYNQYRFQIPSTGVSSTEIKVDCSSVLMKEDTQIEIIRSIGQSPSEKCFQCWIHTSFIETTKLQFSKEQLDDFIGDAQHLQFPKNFGIKMSFYHQQMYDVTGNTLNTSMRKSNEFRDSMNESDTIKVFEQTPTVEETVEIVQPVINEITNLLESVLLTNIYSTIVVLQSKKCKQVTVNLHITNSVPFKVILSHTSSLEPTKGLWQPLKATYSIAHMKQNNTITTLSIPVPPQLIVNKYLCISYYSGPEEKNEAFSLSRVSVTGIQVE